MILVGGAYISDLVFEKSYDETFYVFFAREGIFKETFFTGREENGKMKVIGNREGLSRAVNGDFRIVKIEEYITKTFKEQIKNDK